MKNTIAFFLILSGALLAAAQTVQLEADPRPHVVNGKIVEQALAAALPQAIDRLAATGQAAWVGYSVPMIPGERQLCCFNAGDFRVQGQCCGGCRLEGTNQGEFVGTVDNCRPSRSDRFFVLARVGSGQLLRIRATSIDCGLDLGGLTLYWLGPVKPAESVAWLAAFVARDSRKLHENALTAIALHQEPAAEALLIRYLQPPQPRDVRNQAAFWLASAHGRKGFETVRDAVRNDRDPKFREEAVFALSESLEPEAQQELIRLARRDDDREVRGQALFWLAQKAGRKVGSTITDLIENDPDTDIKKKAVFALTQMDNNEGVPLLIQVAQSNKNPVVRKEAIFWLGQSNDPRALDYIESILKR